MAVLGLSLNDAQTIGILASLILSAVAFIISTYFSYRSALMGALNRVGSAYDKVVEYRLAHPEALAIADNWQKRFYDAVGHDSTITRYYSYGELCIGFFAVYLQTVKSRLVRKHVEEEFGGLLNLLAKENEKFFEDVTSFDYCTPSFREWFREWKEEHGTEQATVE